MKKLKKINTNMHDTIEAYAGICNCAITCSCVSCTSAPTLEKNGSTSVTEANCLSIVSSHHLWA